MSQTFLEDSVPQFRSMKRRQYTAALSATIGAFGTGNMLAWTSPALPNLKNQDDLGALSNLSDSEESWVAATATLGALVAGFAAGFAVDKIGRKLTLITLSLPFVLGWVLMATSSNVAMLIAGRFITGFCGGACTLVVPVYISEIAEDHIRGTLGNAMVLVLVLGILFTNVIGAYVSWDWLSLICGAVPLIMLGCMIFMPDSPRYLLSKGKPNEAAKALQWLRGAENTKEIDDELKDIASSVDNGNNQSATFADLMQISTLKPVGISMTLMLLQQLGGINAVMFYMVDIFESANSTIDASYASMIIGAVQVVFVIVSTILVDRLGRKILLCVSAIGMCVSLVVLGVYFLIKYNNDNRSPDGLGWLPLVSLISYIVFYNLGLGPLPWLMMSELVPPHVKGLASAIATSFNWSLAFLVTKTFTDLQTVLQVHGCYWFFAAVSGVGAIFSFLVVPETKGKNLDEIQRLFKPHDIP